MGYYMRCDHILPNGKRCSKTSSCNRAALQGNDWYIEAKFGGTLTICPKHKHLYAKKTDPLKSWKFLTELGLKGVRATVNDVRRAQAAKRPKRHEKRLMPLRPPKGIFILQPSGTLSPAEIEYLNEVAPWLIKQAVRDRKKKAAAKSAANQPTKPVA